MKMPEKFSVSPTSSHVPTEVMSVLISEVIASRGSNPERLCQLPGVSLNHPQARENVEGREGI